jgi:AcrR family transcriptional regulator
VTATNRGSAERRPRSPRGQGGHLREEIREAATALVAKSGDARGLTLRGVAKRVGVAATSVYLHYADVESLAADVAAHAFAELGAALAAAAPSGADPAETLLARCRAYGHFALSHPGLYRVMFEAPRPDLAAGEPYSLEESPGRAALVRLAGDLERCQEAGLAPAGGDPFRLALVVWATLHGLVSLRISRPRFPWPPLDRMIDDAVGRLVGLARVSTAAAPEGAPAHGGRRRSP